MLVRGALISPQEMKRRWLSFAAIAKLAQALNSRLQRRLLLRSYGRRLCRLIRIARNGRYPEADILHRAA